MSNRGRPRIPGRYERPATLRPALGDRAGEAGVRSGYRAAVAANTAAAHSRTVPVREATENDRKHRRTCEDLLAGLDDDQVAALADMAGDTEEATRFGKLAGKLAAHGAHDPKGLAAWIGRRKYGRAGFAQLAAAGRARRKPVDEALREPLCGTIREASNSPGTYVVDLIRSGWNTSGSRFYPPEVLERDIPKIYPAGTQMFIDHPSASEADDRPERSLTTLAAVLLDDPWPVREDDGGLTMRATARVFAPSQPFLGDAWPYIGISINGGGRGEHGQREGQYGMIMEELTYGRSVDFVTRPGAGGRIVGLLEAARITGRAELMLREAASLGAWVESRIHLSFTSLADDLYGEGKLSRDERIALSSAIGDALGAFVTGVEQSAPQVYQRGRWDTPDDDGGTERVTEATAEEQRRAVDTALQAAYGGEHRFCWARDYDPDRGLVWFDTGPTGDGPQQQAGTWQQSYRRAADGRVELLGDRIQVEPRTVYEPVRLVAAANPDGVQDTTEAHRQPSTPTTAGAPSAGQPGVTPDTIKETDMGEKPADVVAREAAEAQLATVTRERDAALRRFAEMQAVEAARPVLDRLLAESDLPDVARARVRAEYRAGTVPLVEATGALDEGRLRVLAEASICAERAYVAQLAEAAGAGRVVGMGAPAGAGTGVPAAFGGVRTAEADRPDTATVEALAEIYARRGLTADAARQAAAGRR